MLYFTRWKTILIWITVLAGVLLALPNFFTKPQLASLPSWVPTKQMPLGLDLQGGSHILLQVDRQDLIKGRLVATRDDMRRLLVEAHIGYTGLSVTGNAVQVRIRNDADIAKAKDKLKQLLQPITASLFSGGGVSELQMTQPEPGLLRFALTDAGIDYRLSSAVTQSIEVISRRVNELGTTEPVIQRQGLDRILVQVPGLQDPDRLKKILGKTAKLTFQMVDTSNSAQDAVKNGAPAGDEVLYDRSDPPVPYLVQDQILVSGEDLVDAQATFNQRNNEPVVSFRFDTKGAQRFAQATQQNVGKPFAIVLDNQVISAPVIREPILGGSGEISGSFTAQSANDLAVLLRAGALPANLTIIEERTVGPGLGADSIAAGQLAGVIGAVLVVVFMVSAYGLLGVIANVALVANVAMIVAVLSLLGATLTLPGIAGIVLTIGMAVDSNVLIYERVREERRSGKSVIQSIDVGFAKALATIVDANVTTLIAAVILFYLGSGPVRGFAVTLAIGIVTTVFTAFTFTRWLVAEWVRRRRPRELPRAPLHLVPPDTRIPFMRMRHWSFLISALATLGTMAVFATWNLNYGIDFKGGTLFEVQAKQGDASIGDIRSKLSRLNLGDIQAQQFGAPNDVLIRVGTQEGGDNAEQSAVAKVKTALQSDYDFRRVESVGPTVSTELARNGTIGVIVSLLAILVYIWLRFEWQFALGAVIATIHDVIFTIGFFVVMRLEFDLTSIAAILTIVGYSLNDTVVVYDRIREDLRRYKRLPLPQLLDTAMNQTLSRTTLTSLTTLLALIALFLFGGEVIRSFTAAMIFGVAIGTYSSIFIAAPVLILFGLRKGQGLRRKGTAEETDEEGESTGPSAPARA